jgi:hypothetical protein
MTTRLTGTGPSAFTPPRAGLLPEPTFYPSPQLAAKAPPETAAFVSTS